MSKFVDYRNELRTLQAIHHTRRTPQQTERMHQLFGLIHAVGPDYADPWLRPGVWWYNGNMVRVDPRFVPAPLLSLMPLNSASKRAEYDAAYAALKAKAQQLHQSRGGDPADLDRLTNPTDVLNYIPIDDGGYWSQMPAQDAPQTPWG